MGHKISRRTFAATVSAAATALPQSDSRPNIVMVFSDDHSVPILGCYGNKTIRTPNLDRFASEGMRFERMFTAAPQCVPSRAAYLTGRSPVAVRMGRFNSPLPPDVKTLPEHLREAGYFTGVCRRLFHLDGPGAGAIGPVNRELFDRNHMMTWDKRVDWLDRGSPRAQTKNKVNEFLGKVPAGKPFYLWINFNDPHHPWDDNAIPQPHDAAKIDVPGYLPDLPGMRDDLRRYYDEVARADEEFQWILDILEQKGLKQNTIVVFAGDNGLALPHGKGSLYDPGLHVPLMIRWPGRVKPGSVTDQLVSGEDLAPTLLEAAGIAKPKEMSGQSYLPLLQGKSHAGRKYIFGARLYHGSQPFTEKTKSNNFDLSRCVRSDRYKLIYNCTPQMEYSPVDSAAGPGWTGMVDAYKSGTLAPKFAKAYFGKRTVWELYDLAEDPNEFNNIAGKPELASIQREMTIALQEKMIQDYDFLPLPLHLNE